MDKFGENIYGTDRTPGDGMSSLCSDISEDEDSKETSKNDNDLSHMLLSTMPFQCEEEEEVKSEEEEELHPWSRSSPADPFYKRNFR